jgi:uncharacterized protein with PQ loop repeat
MMWAWVAGLGMWLMEFSYVPQLYRMWQVKDARGISLLFPLLNVTGRFLAMLYTWQAGELVLATGFLVGWTLRMSFLFQIIYYRWQAYQREHEQTAHSLLLGRAAAVSHAATPTVPSP